MRRLILALVAGLIPALPAWADRAVSDAERAKLTAAVTAPQCAGGKMEFDDGAFEVDGAKCADGNTYDLKFDAQFQLVKEELED